MSVVCLVAFDQFTDIDLFLAWDLLKRVELDEWTVRIVGFRDVHRSLSGLELPMDGAVEECAAADAVLVGSGPGARAAVRSESLLARLELDPSKQLIGSQCSGATVLAALGLLAGQRATTHRRAVPVLESQGISFVEKPLVVHENVATAGGCLAAPALVSWVLRRLLGEDQQREILESAAPVGQEARYLAEIDRVLAEASR